MDKTKRPPRRSNTVLIVLLIGLALAAILFFGNLKFHDGQNSHKTKELEQAAPSFQQAADNNTMPTDSAPSPDHQEQPADHQAECNRIIAGINTFFAELDKKDYISAYQLQDGSLNHFNRLLDKLLANPPIVARETDDLFAILKNMAHFFQVLGSRDILLIKDVLNREAESLEPVWALFNSWSELESCPGENDMNRMKVDEMYEYAGFFLNTIGGQAYLFRRPSPTRLLVKYYSIRILDRANSKGINRYGIDIRFPISSLINELETSQLPIDREHYLNELYRLQGKYQMEYGAG